MADWRKKKERKEAWMRILVLIISGIVLCVWKTLIIVLGIIHWFMVVFTGKRNKGLAKFSEIWNTQVYVYIRYLTFVSNKRPTPFATLTENMSQFER